MFLRDRKGSVAVIAALTMPLIIGGAGFGVETGFDFYVQVKLQQAADAAAYGGGVEQQRGSTSDVVLTAATAAATQNGFNAAIDSISVTSPTATSVQASLTRSQPRMFSALFINSPLVIAVNAVSTYGSSADACILALDPIASGAAGFSGSSTTTLNNCVVMANSISSSAITVQGAAQVTTPCLYTVGGVSVTSGAVLTCAAPLTGLAPIGDPYKSVPLPADTGPCLSSAGATLSPGRYCGGMTMHGTTNFSPGVYIFDGGTFKTNANANLSGTGVTFVFLNNATLDLNGSGHMQFSAPTTGTYAGMLMIGAASNANNTVKINGDSASSMTGAIYFPSQDVSYIGNFSGTNGCTQIVAKTISWSGNASLAVNCSAYGISPIAVGSVNLTG